MKNLIELEVMMLRNIKLDKKPDGKTIFIPASITENTIEQQMKIIIEMVDYSTFDAHSHLSRFRSFYGGNITIQILQKAIDELYTPYINLEIRTQREVLRPFFEEELSLHSIMKDEQFYYPKDRSVLPI